MPMDDHVIQDQLYASFKANTTEKKNGGGNATGAGGRASYTPGGPIAAPMIRKSEICLTCTLLSLFEKYYN